MDERQALKALRHGDESALVWFMDRYIPYVNAVVFGIMGSAVPSSDAEEMGMNLSTVKTRLRRGRERLKDELKKGGYLDEDL